MKKKIPVNLLRLVLLGCVIPIILSFIVYYGFATNYTGNVFSEQGFKNQYEGGIYKYRILGNFLLLKTYSLVKDQNLPSLAPHSLALLDPNGRSEFYAAYFYLNTFFLCLTSVVLMLTLGGREDEANFLAVDAPMMFLIAIMSIGQYVVVPYDILSYFFLSVAAFLIYQRKDASVNSIVLCIVVILATLTRETAILIPAFFLSVNYRAIFVKPKGFSLNPQQGSLLLMSVGYAGAYIFLRLLLGSDHFFAQGLFIYSTSNPFPILGIIFLISILALFYISKPVSQEMIIFLMVSLPYSMLIIIIANPWEIRLWMPLIILLFILKIKAALQDWERQTINQI